MAEDVARREPRYNADDVEDALWLVKEGRHPYTEVADLTEEQQYYLKKTAVYRLEERLQRREEERRAARA